MNYHLENESLIELVEKKKKLFLYLLDCGFAYTSSSLTDPSSTQVPDEDNLSDTEYCQREKKISLPKLNGHSHYSMLNGYNQYAQSERSRSCENSLDSCGQKGTDELTISSSSLVDLPLPSASHADYDNLASVNGTNHVNEQSSLTKHVTQSTSPISCELDQKTKDAIDARLKDIDDEFDFNCKDVFLFLSESENRTILI